ncbi:MAG: AMP-binding protein [Kiritimatiellae bacterium]|nr:AMP-binding protein [Kiritimatiellia bacterium]
MNREQSNNIVSLLDAAAARVAARPALCYQGRECTFKELQHRVQRFAAVLSYRGLKPGERVIIMIPMSPELYVALLAVIRCGAVAVFVDPWISITRIAAFASFAEPSAFIGVPKSHLLRLLNPRLAGLKLTFSTGRVAARIPARYSINQGCRAPALHSVEAVAADDPALITFTTGSSDTPKGTNRTHGFLMAQNSALCETLDYSDQDVDMPMFPVFALRNIAAGITSVVPEINFKRVAEADPQVIRQQIQDHGVTMLTASPPLIDRLASLAAPPPLKKIITGGAPVTAKQLRAWKQAFPAADVNIVYGSTEAEPVAHLALAERLSTEHLPGACCGKPVPAVRAKIVKITHDPIPPDQLAEFELPQGEIGELVVAADHICRDYYRNPRAVVQNKILEPDGTCWHRMGDTGYFDQEGRFFLTGRVHSTIIRNGEMLHAQLEEERLRQLLPDAERVAAFEEHGKLVAVVQTKRANRKDAAELDVDRVIFTSKRLPLDPRHNSKIDYAQLKRVFEKLP